MQDFIFSLNIDNVQHTTKPSKEEMGIINNRVIKESNYIPVNFDEFVKMVTLEGKSFLPGHFSNETRQNKYFQYQFMFCLDIDHGETLQEGLDICKRYNIIPNLIYTTFSHTEKEHRYRIVWFLNEIVEDVRLQKFIQLGLMRFFKGHDKGCSDKTRMFNGSSSGPWYINKDTILTVPDLFIGLNNLFRKDNNATKNTEAFAKQVGVNMINGYLDCKIVNETIVDYTKKNVYLSTTKNNYNVNYNGVEENKKNYSINFCNCFGTAEEELQQIEKIKSKRQLKRNFDFLLLNGKCQLFRDGLELKHKIEHKEMFGMFTNLLAIQGSEKYVKQIVNNVLKTTSKSYEEKLSNIENTIKQIKKVGYEPMKCCNHCSFYWNGDCNSDSTMIEHTEILKNNQPVKVKNKTQIRTIEEVRKDLRGLMNKFVEEDNKLMVVKAPTGIGKTEEFINIVDKVDGLVYAAPTHKLIRNVADRLKDKGYRENVDFMVYPELPEEFENKDFIEQLYACGAFKRAGAELKRISQTDANVKEYIEQKRRCENFEKLILITHQRLIFSPLKQTHKRYVVDEDIFLNTMFPVQKVKITDLVNVVNSISQTDYQQKDTLNSFYKEVMGCNTCLVYKTPKTIFLDKDELLKFIMPLIRTKRIDTNIVGFMRSDCFVKDSKNEYIYYIKRNGFNVMELDASIIVLSATVNKYFTEAAYKHAEFFDLGQVKFKGNLYQIPSRSLSRSCIRSNLKGYTKYTKKLCEKYLGSDYNLITFPEFLGEEKEDKSINLWNCLGLDNIQEKDLAVVGTPHCPEIVYSLMCSVLELDINNAEQDYRLIRRNGFEFFFQSFSNNFMLSEIQLYMIESVLMQCIGRARLINNPNRNVLLLSNYMLPQAQILNYTNREIKSIMEDAD